MQKNCLSKFITGMKKLCLINFFTIPKKKKVFVFKNQNNIKIRFSLLFIIILKSICFLRMLKGLQFNFYQFFLISKLLFS